LELSPYFLTYRVSSGFYSCLSIMLIQGHSLMQRFRKRRFKQNKVHSNNPRDNLFYRIFDRLPLPIFIINNNCSIFYKNKEAVKIILKSRNKSARNLKHLFVNPEDKQKLINSLTSSSKSLENIKIPVNFNYQKIKSISFEAREKLTKIQPTTISQASRISGVSPSDVSVLLVYMGR